MKACSLKFRFALVVCAVLATGACADPCDPSMAGAEPGMSPRELDVLCYTGKFLIKMLGELNRGSALGAFRKSEQHVRVHLLPYLGSSLTINLLLSERPQSANCTVCYTSQSIHAALEELRSAVPAERRRAYDSHGVCVAALGEAILSRLPKHSDAHGTRFLVPAVPPLDPLNQTLQIMRDIFDAEPPGVLFNPACADPNSALPSRRLWNSTMPQWVDLCDSSVSGVTDADQLAVLCYISNFLEWMLGELTRSAPLGEARKTAEHVRIHLLPYLGGERTVQALLSDSPNDPNCTVCYADHYTSTNVSSWIPNVELGARMRYAALQVCYEAICDAVMAALPKSTGGHFLVPAAWPETAASVTLRIVRSIFASAGNSRGC